MQEKKIPAHYNAENEQYVVSYLMHKPEMAASINMDYFIHPTSRLIALCVKEMYMRQLDFSLDTLLVVIRERGYSNFQPQILYDIFNGYEDFTNANYHLQVLHSDWTKHVLKEQAFEDILVKISSGGLVKTDEIQSTVEKLYYQVMALSDINQIYTPEELAKKHTRVMERRNAGEVSRSIGLYYLDELLTKPAAPGEITLIVGQKGTGKSITLKTIENGLLNLNIPVLSFNFEMSDESSMDRLLCIRENISIRTLQRKDLETSNPREWYRVQTALKNFAKIRHYKFVCEPSLKFADIDRIIYEFKYSLKSQGLLPEDDYIVTTFDLLSMVRDFKRKTWDDIEMAMDELNILVKKQRCHAIGLVQANENKFREGGKIIKNPNDLDYYKVGLEDIKGGAAYAERARVVVSLNRPLYLKKLFFPEKPEIWENEEDLIYMNVLKQNDGNLGSVVCRFDDNFRMGKVNPNEIKKKNSVDKRKSRINTSLETEDEPEL